ncbi:malonic semialdehyde reductase [Lichenicoccus roseus]|uniref:Putative NADH dehydrogenase/NAD(P)H nitroreductase FE263_09700 n=2 Tax=Lichenicoccus roseus TaxID=2683649 RepID=A0A5R9JB31_9PROT|nr:malonic semialdehyde reductase [Lichenicoccus roseus]
MQPGSEPAEGLTGTARAGDEHHARAAVADVPAGVPDAVLEQVFRQARTPERWRDLPVPETLLHALYELVKLGPTSGNCSPARFVFLASRDSRERLRPALSSGNVERTMSAPLTVIVAQDPLFYEQLPRLYPQVEARSWFAADIVLAEETASRNGSLQGGYLILAARMLGLDAAPMSGFDNDKVDEIFLSGQGWRSNFLLNLGYADGEPSHPRAPRLAFDEACLLL